jgi:filamentous hemagglutinin
MNQVFESSPFGKRLEQNLERIEGAKYQGRQGYRVKNDMPDLGIKSGDKLYLDGLHGDHIEVFKGNPRPGSAPRQVISVDGRTLPEKLAKAIRDGRTCLF